MRHQALPSWLTDIGFVEASGGSSSGGGSGGSGITPDDTIIASTQSGAVVDLVFGVDYSNFEPFGSGSIFDAAHTGDADYSPAFAVTTGNGYGAQVGQLAFAGFAAGFGVGYDSVVFKAKALDSDFIRVQFNPGGYVDIDLTSSSFSVALANGWYQVSIPLTEFNAGEVAAATALLFETNNSAPSSFTFLLTDIGFVEASGGRSSGGSSSGGSSSGWWQFPWR